jgi:glyoxylase-like metal-dependent hydrolase (beta-lactamase superfamily II)/rhodanese-related sulfurtransferase
MALILKQYYLACLSHASYLVGDSSSGRAVVVDPQRDVSQYVGDARELGLTIERVIETHFHADFLSGHLELAAEAGAIISYGSAAAGLTDFPIDAVTHGQRLSLGQVELEVLETPGHTPESICVVVREKADAVPHAVLTGDTLFIGDVGRPDLLSSFGRTQDEMARSLYHSLRNHLLSLPDATLVYPAHGAGSACGKNLSTETVSTIGEQRRTNYALAPMSEEEFSKIVTEGQAAAPLYFSFAATRNRAARENLDEDSAPTALTWSEFQKHVSDGAIIVDSREPDEFARGHVRGSRNIGLSGRFAEYVGEVVRPGESIVLVSTPGTESEAKVRLARIGYDKVLGVLADPVRAMLEHPDDVRIASRVNAEQLESLRGSLNNLAIIDVRGPGELADGTVTGARHIQLASLLERVSELDPTSPTVVYCAGGYRSSIAASTLRSLGFSDVSDIVGGYGAWRTQVSSSSGKVRPANASRK